MYLYIRAKSGAAPLRSSKGQEEEGRKSVWDRVGNVVSVLVSFAACLAKGRDCLYPCVSGILYTREREGESDRQTDRQRQRNGDRDSETRRETERQIERHQLADKDIFMLFKKDLDVLPL